MTEEVAASFALPVVVQFTVTPESALPLLSVTVARATFGVTPSAKELSVVIVTAIDFWISTNVVVTDPFASPAVAVTVRPLSATLSVRLTLALPFTSVTEEVAASFALPVVVQFTVTPESALPLLSVTVALATFAVTPSAGELSVVMVTAMFC